MRPKLHILCLMLVCGLFACKPGVEPAQQQTEQGSKNSSTNYPLHFAKRFAIAVQGGDTSVYLFGNRSNWDTTAVFVLHQEAYKLVQKKYPVYFIPTPLNRLAALSSIYASMFAELGELEKICAIDNMNYILREDLTAKFNKGEITELMKSPDLNLEQTLKVKPDLVFCFGMGNPSEDGYPRLREAGIPVAVSVDHLEETPLARAEWIKFYAVFVGRLQLADSLFGVVEKNYSEIQNKLLAVTQRPTVFTETLYGDLWYMPGGNSYMARLIKDAGGHYLWDDNNETGSLALSYEQVYARAVKADYWINLSTFRTKRELLQSDDRYAPFAAVKQNHLYNNNKYVNSKGYTAYWESGMAHPDRILSDLAQVLHPELYRLHPVAFYYYHLLP